MQGDLPRNETKAVVRHLLRGCGDCLLVTRRLWQLGEQPCVGRRAGQGIDEPGLITRRSSR
jgi:hypothetical protein